MYSLKFLALLKKSSSILLVVEGELVGSPLEEDSPAGPVGEPMGFVAMRLRGFGCTRRGAAGLLLSSESDIMFDARLSLFSLSIEGCIVGCEYEKE